MTKAERLLGLATRAGKTVTGTDLCEKAVKTGKGKLVVLSNDISQSTEKIFISLGVPVIYVESEEKLGKCTGKDARKVAVITEKEFADAILKAYNNKEE